MPLELSFKLTDRDLQFFRDALQRCRTVVENADENEVLDAIRDVISEIRQNEPLPDFVAHRLPEMESMIQMVRDEEWRLPQEDREHVLSAFVYFGDPEDILPDDVPVIGYLDDVIILELVALELKHAIEAYTEFCEFREQYDHDHAEKSDAAVRRDRLDRQRQQLHMRMQRRAANDRKNGLRQGL